MKRQHIVVMELSPSTEEKEQKNLMTIIVSYMTTERELHSSGVLRSE
jgi:hypothetical protein